LRKNNLRCKGCEPKDSEIYVQDIIDLYLDGRNGPEIADSLDISITLVYSVIHAYREKIGIKEPEIEYSYAEIAEYLGLSDQQVRTAYAKGMKKIKEYLLSLDDFKEMA